MAQTSGVGWTPLTVKTVDVVLIRVQGALHACAHRPVPCRPCEAVVEFRHAHLLGGEGADCEGAITYTLHMDLVQHLHLLLFSVC